MYFVNKTSSNTFKFSTIVQLSNLTNALEMASQDGLYYGGIHKLYHHLLQVVMNVGELHNSESTIDFTLDHWFIPATKKSSSTLTQTAPNAPGRLFLWAVK